jgi:hypothetical protein
MTFTSFPTLLRFIPSPHYSSNQLVVLNQREQFQITSVGSAVGSA